MRPLDWLLAHQNADGSWGEDAASVEGLPMGRLGVTAFALNAIHGYGYTPFSNDLRDGRAVGPLMRCGIDWLVRSQRPDGSFQGAVGDFDDFLAAEVLIWTYAMTEDRSLKDPARAALASVTGKRRPDGSWGSPEGTFMAMAVLESARMAELEYDRRALEEVLRRIEEEFNSRPDRYNAIAPRIRHYRGPSEARRSSLAWVMKRLPDPWSPDFIDVYFGSILVYGVSMHFDPEWLQWTQALEGFVEATIAGDGSWRGPTTNATVVRTAVVGLCHAAYRGSRKFESVFSKKK